MKDYNLTLRNLRASHKLRSLFVYYESIKREPKIRGIYEKLKEKKEKKKYHGGRSLQQA
jgi:hypothetical protein